MTALYAGIDLGGTTIDGVLADDAGRVVAHAQVATESHAGPAAVLERIAGLVEELSLAAGSSALAVGVGCPGLVDVRAGVTRFFPNLPTQWRDVPAAGVLANRLKRPVYLLNDVRAATLGELVFGHGRDVQTMAFFSLGTGVGGGLVIDGKLRLGPLGAAGELGHQTILPHGPPCGCGNSGCLETLASGPAITAEGVRLMLSGQAPRLYELAGGNPANVSPRTMAAAAREGDAGAAGAVSRAAGHLGVGVANVVTILHPQLVVLGGGVAEMGDLLLAPVRRVLRERVRMFPTDDVRVELSLLGPRAGALGGAALALRGPANL
jgi:glucokinase